jgi:trimeric autotransporter adhesin
MNTLYRSSLGLMVAIAVTGTAYAQVPSTNDTSDEYNNTGMGTNALSGGGINSACEIGEPNLLSSDCYNTAAGYAALSSNTTGGNYNTGVGFVVLYQNTSGYYNTASGAGALEQNTTGASNTAIGFGALSSNILGNNNTRSTGSNNTASGAQSLYLNTTGDDNTAAGYAALYSNTTGSVNTASGLQALFSNTAGIFNTASGVNALYSNTTGSTNTASGVNALYSNTTGNNNIAEGFRAGSNLTTGSNNIDIGNVGFAGDTDTIRIGTVSTQGATYIAGIYGTSVSGSAVMISSTGQLGVTVSSERFKTGIAPMGSNTAKLGQLRPVTFHLKTDPKGALQYGLIAEEVARVYPDLVVRDEKGRIDGVRYDELAPMLLNELQKQQKAATAQAAAISELKQQLSMLRAALVKLQATDGLVAQR